MPNQDETEAWRYPASFVNAYPASVYLQTWHEAFRLEDWRLVIYGQDPFWLHANGWWESAYISSPYEEQELLCFCADCNVSPTTVAEVRRGQHPIPGMTVYEYCYESVPRQLRGSYRYESVPNQENITNPIVLDTWYHEADVAAGPG